MLSYRHGFHAGNAADVLKHTVLIFCLDYLLQKEKPVLCIDTHAGAGLYPLDTGFAAKNCEWEKGIGQFCGLTPDGAAERCGRAAGAISQPRLRQAPPGMIRRYLEIAGIHGVSPAMTPYPGSPEIIRRLLRPGDRACFFELHPADFGLLAELMRSDGRIKVTREDGLAGLKALLPPPSRRGLVFIDPSYEVKDDYIRVPETLAGALRRFPGGIYITWYPLLRESPLPRGAAFIRSSAEEFPEKLMGLYGGNRCRLELYAAGLRQAENSPRGMYGNGLVIYNPPWTLKAALKESLAFLSCLPGSETEKQILDWIGA
ncbi:MAG: 23S rRNA (adenine(2030)-N(6))-methyltransferase RlmJ [Treponema sp.]|jgi:23S rRNA (adenine2030-N6)-methyltransferase|nr:23S rRNA (adenine(2030)-N(6))-methyltransferase RlmJ [Treponema sp.]